MRVLSRSSLTTLVGMLVTVATVLGSLGAAAPSALAATTVADFATSPPQPAPGSTVVFLGRCSDSQAAPTYRWDFDTSDTSGWEATGARAEHAYPRAGTYRAAAEITGCAGTTVVTHDVVVSTPPDAAFTFRPPTPAPGDVVSFDARASRDAEDGTNLTYAWDFDNDGRVDATGATPTHVFTERATYPVKLTVTDRAGFTASVRHDVPVNRPPVARLAPPPTGKVSGQPVTFDASGSSDPDSSQPLRFDWDFDGDGHVDATDAGPRPTHTYGAPGGYRVVVIVHDADGGSDWAETTITIAKAPPVARLAVSSTDVATLDPVSFDASASSDPDSTALTYRWDLGDGTSATGATVSHAYTAIGTYTVTLTVRDESGNEGHQQTTIRVRNAAPHIVVDRIAQARPGAALTMDASRTFDPEGGEVTLTWDLPGATPGSATGPTVTARYAQPGTYQAHVAATDERGAVRRVDVAVYIDDDVVTRRAGSNRIDTAASLSQAAFPSAHDAILARADQFPDALAASALAAQVDGPILLTNSDALHPSTAAELQRLGVAHVYLAGGTAALAPQVDDDLAQLGIATTRLAGSSRFETAAAIADEIVRIGGRVSQVVVALGASPDASRAWPDALVAGNLAVTGRAPIVLVQPDGVPAASMAAIRRVLAGRQVWITGGDRAVHPATEQQLRDAGYDVRRLAGPDRYATAVTVVEEARRQGASVAPTVLASGLNFPDALVAVPVAWKLGGVLLLVDATDLDHSDVTGAWLTVHRDAVDDAYLAGGAGAIADRVRLQVFDRIQDRPAR